MTVTSEDPGAAGTVHVAPPTKASAGAGAARSRALASAISRRGAVVVLILVLILGNFIVPHFGSAANLRNTALSASFIAIIAAGMTFVIISGGIDLSVGSVFALGVLVSAFMSKHGSLAAVVIPLVICGIAGLIQGLIIAYLRLPPFIVTLAGLLGIRGVVYFITDEGNLHPQVPGHKAFETLGQGTFLTIGYPIWITLVVFAIGWWLLNRTSFGQSVQAIGESETSARLMGLPVRRVTTTVYVISAVLAGLAGVITTAQSGGGQEARIGDAFELSAIAAVVIGGTLLTGGIGSMVGTLAGAALLFVIQNLITQGAHAKPYVQLVIRGAFLLVVAVLQTVLSRRSQQGP
jgi:ribose transport system permease protein